MRWFRLPLVSVVSLALLGSGVACRRNPAAAKRKFVEDGDRYVAAGKFPEAIIQYRNAVGIEATGDVRAKLAEASLAAGDLSGALREYVRAADLLPDDLALQLKTGGLLLLAGRFDEAMLRAQYVLDKKPESIDAQILSANALAGLKDVDKALEQIEEAVRVAPERSGTYSNLGAIELGRGRQDAAEKAFQKAVALEPDSIPARLALGNFFWLTRRPAEAEESFNEALRLDSRNPLTNRLLASFFLATHQLARAEQPLKTVFDVTKTGDAALALEEYYVATGQQDAARAMLQPMLSDSRTAATANVRLAVLEYKDGRHDVAYQRLATVLDRNPGHLQALLARVSFLVNDREIEQALATANASVQHHPDSAASYFALGQVQTLRRQSDAAITAYQEALRLNPRATEAKIELGKLRLAQGRADASVGFAAEALATEPGNGDAQLLYVRGLLAQGALSRAEAEMKPLTARFPQSAVVHAQMGILAGRQGRLSAARTEFERALALQPENLEALGGMVALDVANKDFAHARARVDARMSSGITAPLLTLAARTYGSSGDLGSAERFLRQAIALDDGYVAAYGALGQLYVALGRLDAARAEFETLAARSPDAVAAHTMVAIILETQGDWRAARDRFERVLQIDPEAAVAANNLAWIYAEHDGNLDVAMHLAQTAQKRLPGVASVNDTLGFIYYRKNLTALAISTLKEAAEAEPGNASYHYHLGLAYAAAGDTTRARASFTRALALQPDLKDAGRALNLLDTKAAR